MRKTTTAVAGGGLGRVELLDPVRQAFPARTLWLLIRMAGTEMSAINAVQRLAFRTIALTLTLCMTLDAVEQRLRGPVKQ